VTRWNRRLLLGAVALLVPLLAGCEAGLNAPTLEFHPASIGTTVLQNNIRLNNVFVLAAPLGMSVPAGGRVGAFLAIYAENGPDRLVSVSAPGAASSVRLLGGPVNVPANTLVNLGGPRPRVVLTGLVNPLNGGESVTLTFNFAVAGPITIAVPVEPQAYEFATYSPPVLPVVTPSHTGTKAHATPSPTATP
jgi:copper(I)-binding protein